MFLGIIVDVCNQVPEIVFICDEFAVEGFLKQVACTPVDFVDRFGICIEQVAEALTGG